jgi:uncharacterized phiE125 gp8 family phage protein
MNWDRVSVTVGPTGPSVSIKDVKARARIDFDFDDSLILSLINGSEARIDGPSGIGYALLSQTWRLSLDCFPSCVIDLPGAPIKSVVSVNYVDVNGVDQVVDISDWHLDIYSSPARLSPSYGKSWPVTREQNSAVWIQYVLGEANSKNVKGDLIDALMLLISNRYENREAVSVVQLHEIPLGVESILREYRQLGITS